MVTYLRLGHSQVNQNMIVHLLLQAACCCVKFISRDKKVAGPAALHPPAFALLLLCILPCFPSCCFETFPSCCSAACTLQCCCRCSEADCHGNFLAKACNVSCHFALGRQQQSAVRRPVRLYQCPCMMQHQCRLRAFLLCYWTLVLQ